jgi:hypothetical protein
VVGHGCSGLPLRSARQVWLAAGTGS